MPQDAHAARTTAITGPATQSFRCRWRADQLGAAWIDVTGDIDHASAPALVRVLHHAQGGARLVVLDLREAALLDAAGERVIREAAIRAQREGQQLVLAKRHDQLDALFALADTPPLQVCSLHPAEPSVQVLLRLAANTQTPAPL